MSQFGEPYSGPGWSTAAADVSMAALQDQIADTLVSDPPSHVMDTNPATGELSLMSPAEAGLDVVEYGDDYAENNAQEESQEIEPEGVQRETDEAPDAEEAIQELQHDLRDEQAQQLANEQVQQFVAPELGESLKAMDTEAERLGMPDVEGAANFFNEMAALAPGTGEQFDPQALDATANRVAMSAINAFCYGDMSRMPQISPNAAMQYTNDNLTAWGIDPRIVQVDHQQFAHGDLMGMMSLLKSWVDSGFNSDPRALNSAEAAVS